MNSNLDEDIYVSFVFSVNVSLQADTQDFKNFSHSTSVNIDSNSVYIVRSNSLKNQEYWPRYHGPTHWPIFLTSVVRVDIIHCSHNRR